MDSATVVGGKRVQKNPGFLKSLTNWVFGVLLGFGLYCFFTFLFERAVGKFAG